MRTSGYEPVDDEVLPPLENTEDDIVGFPSVTDQDYQALITYIKNFTNNQPIYCPGKILTRNVSKIFVKVHEQDVADGITVKVALDLGFSFGGLMSYICLVLKYFVIGVEYDDLRYSFSQLYHSNLLSDGNNNIMKKSAVFKDIAFNMTFMKENEALNTLPELLKRLGPELGTITLVFWFSSGWNAEDGRKYTQILLTLPQLRHLVTDWNPKELADFGFGKMNTRILTLYTVMHV